MRQIAAPCGSKKTEKRPTFGISIGGTHTFAPSCTAREVRSLQSFTVTYTDQCGGTPVHSSPFIGSMPPMGFSPLTHSVYWASAIPVSGFVFHPNKPL